MLVTSVGLVWFLKWKSFRLLTDWNHTLVSKFQAPYPHLNRETPNAIWWLLTTIPKTEIKYASQNTYLIIAQAIGDLMGR